MSGEHSLVMPWVLIVITDGLIWVMVWSLFFLCYCCPFSIDVMALCPCAMFLFVCLLVVVIGLRIICHSLLNLNMIHTYISFNMCSVFFSESSCQPACWHRLSPCQSIHPADVSTHNVGRVLSGHVLHTCDLVYKSLIMQVRQARTEATAREWISGTELIHTHATYHRHSIWRKKESWLGTTLLDTEH